MHVRVIEEEVEMLDDELIELSEAGLASLELDEEVHGFEDRGNPHFAERLEAGFDLIETNHY